MSTDRVKINKADREKYAEIKDSNGDLKGCENSDILMIAAMMAFYEKGPNSIKDCPPANEAFVLENYLSETQENIMKVLAVATKNDINVLSDKSEIFKITENYATVGIPILYKKYFADQYDFIEVMEEMLIDFCNKHEDLKNNA